MKMKRRVAAGIWTLGRLSRLTQIRVVKLVLEGIRIQQRDAIRFGLDDKNFAPHVPRGAQRFTPTGRLERRKSGARPQRTFQTVPLADLALRFAST